MLSKKTILLIRHAKSEWNDPSLSDFDRPLNERGKRDAPRMADFLFRKKIRPDRLLVSPAKRARTTAKVFAKALGVQEDQLDFHDDLYLAPPEVFERLIREAADTDNSLALFAHNPGITDFVNRLGLIYIDNIPTCGIACISSATSEWKTFFESPLTFEFFEYPKGLTD